MGFRADRLAWLAVFGTLLVAPAASAPPSADAAGVALHAGNASNAVALATQALADSTLSRRDRAHVLVDRGLAHEMLGEHDAAMVDFTEAINARVLAGPDQARAFYNRGVSLDALGQTEDAVAVPVGVPAAPGLACGETPTGPPVSCERGSMNQPGESA